MKNVRKMTILLLAALVIIAIVLSLQSCSHTYQEAISSAPEDTGRAGGYFTEITEWWDESGTYYIVYANDTNIKYFIARSNYGSGITPLYNADGTLQIYVPEG